MKFRIVNNRWGYEVQRRIFLFWFEISSSGTYLTGTNVSSTIEEAEKTAWKYYDTRKKRKDKVVKHLVIGEGHE